MEYPIYRKYVGIDVWFKIINDHRFIEIKKIGEKFSISTVDAIQYPEKLRIQDMIAMHENRWEPCDAVIVERLIR